MSSAGASSTRVGQGSGDFVTASKPKAPRCPAGHRLKRLNIGYVPGTCDGCKGRMKAMDLVMDCRKCNWYLCQWCCPQRDVDQFEKILMLVHSACHDDIKEFRDDVAAGCATTPFAACGAVAQAKKASDAEEITVARASEASGSAAPEHDNGSSAAAEQPTKVTDDSVAPPEQDTKQADEQPVSVDLLGLFSDETAKVERTEERGPVDLLAFQAGA